MEPWVIGWVASDGHNAGNYWSISQNINDVDALCLIREMYQDITFNISFNTANRYGDKPMVSIKRKNQLDCNELVNWGVPIGDKTFTLTFPKDAPDCSLWAYLRGFFEGDGSLSIEKYRYPKFGVTSSKLWCDGCKEWLKKHSIISCVSRDGDNAYSLNVHSIKGVKKIIQNMYPQGNEFKLSRKYSTAMKILILLEYWEEKKNKNILKKNIERKVVSAINTGMSVEKISRNLNCSISSVTKIRSSMGIVGHASNAKIEEIQSNLRRGLDRETLVRMGYGKKIVNKSFKLLYGDPKLIRKKRDEDIRAMILEGCSIKDIVRKMKCGEAKVIKEKRYLFSLGCNIKLNKVKGWGGIV